MSSRSPADEAARRAVRDFAIYECVKGGSTQVAIGKRWGISAHRVHQILWRDEQRRRREQVVYDRVMLNPAVLAWAAAGGCDALESA